MKQAIINWLKESGGKHLEALVIAAALIFGGRMWLQEHDARLQADTEVKAAQTTIDTLSKQQTATAQAAKVEVTVLQKEAKAVVTAQDAVKDLQTPKADMASVVEPLAVTAVPDAPDKVTVDALPLDKTLNACRQDGVNLGACAKELDIQKQIDTQKDVQIVALKKKPGFWHRLGRAAKIVGCSAAGGYAGSFAGKEGAAIGAAAGAGLCQMF